MFPLEGNNKTIKLDTTIIQDIIMRSIRLLQCRRKIPPSSEEKIQPPVNKTGPRNKITNKNQKNMVVVISLSAPSPLDQHLSKVARASPNNIRYSEAKIFLFNTL
jgi:hypothetical protein